MIRLNIHDVWPRPKRGGDSQKKTPVDHVIGHIPLLYKKYDKRPDTDIILSKSRVFEQSMLKSREN